jgi:hypothetical protein
LVLRICSSREMLGTSGSSSAPLADGCTLWCSYGARSYILVAGIGKLVGVFIVECLDKL